MLRLAAAQRKERFPVQRTVPKLLVAGSMLLLGSASQEDKKPIERDRPCLIFISKPASDDESLVKVVEEIENKVEEKKKWFRLAENPLGADIRIEVTRHGRADQAKSPGNREEGVQGANNQGATVTRPGLLDIESGYFIEFLLVVPQQFRRTMTTTGCGPGSAAKDVARMLRTICDTYCR